MIWLYCSPLTPSQDDVEMDDAAVFDDPETGKQKVSYFALVQGYLTLSLTKALALSEKAQPYNCHRLDVGTAVLEGLDCSLFSRSTGDFC